VTDKVYESCLKRGERGTDLKILWGGSETLSSAGGEKWEKFIRVSLREGEKNSTSIRLSWLSYSRDRERRGGLSLTTLVKEEGFSLARKEALLLFHLIRVAMIIPRERYGEEDNREGIGTYGVPVSSKKRRKGAPFSLRGVRDSLISYRIGEKGGGEGVLSLEVKEKKKGLFDLRADQGRKNLLGGKERDPVVASRKSTRRGERRNFTVEAAQRKKKLYLARAGKKGKRPCASFRGDLAERSITA